MRRILCISLVIFLWVAWAWGQEKNPILAEIKRPKIVITLKDLEKYISFYGEEAQKYLQSPEKKAEFLQDVVKMFAIAAYAQEQGFTQRPDIQEKIAFLSQKFIAKEYLKERLEQALQKKAITKEDIELYYKTHQEEFYSPPKVRLATVAFRGPEEKLEAVQKKAPEILKQLQEGHFSWPLDPALQIQIVGDSGLLPVKQFESLLGSLPLELPLGKWSEPIKTKRALYFVKVLEREEAKLLPLKEVEEKIQKKLLAELRQAELKKIINEILRAEEVQIYYQNLLKP